MVMHTYLYYFLPCILPTEVEAFNDGRLVIRAAAWQVKVCVCGLGMLPPRLNTIEVVSEAEVIYDIYDMIYIIRYVSPVCDESASEGSLRANTALYKLTFTLLTCLLTSSMP